MATPWVEILRSASLGTFQGPNGDYPSVLEALDGLTAVRAVWKPAPDRHSIWQIVDHLTKSKEWERRVILGERPSAPAWDDPTGEDDAWRGAIEQLRTAQAQLLEAIDHLAEDDLWKRPPTRLGWPIVNLVLNKTAHDAYHAGQIRHLRALIGTLNDEMVTCLVRQGAIPAGRIEAAFHAVAREHFLPGVPLESVYSGEAVITRRGVDGYAVSSSSMPEIMVPRRRRDFSPMERRSRLMWGKVYSTPKFRCTRLWIISRVHCLSGRVWTHWTISERCSSVSLGGRDGVR